MTRFRFASLLSLIALMGAAPAMAQLTPAEQKMTAIVDAEYERSVSLLEKLVNQNSGSMNLEGVEAVGKMMRAELEPLGFRVTWVPMRETGRAGHLVAVHQGRKGTKRLLLI
ncbi:MAG: M20 family peptidase, partial [Sphingomonadaceae bacterium]